MRYLLTFFLKFANDPDAFTCRERIFQMFEPENAKLVLYIGLFWVGVTVIYGFQESDLSECVMNSIKYGGLFQYDRVF